MVNLIKSAGLVCEDEQKAVTFIKIGIILGEVLTNNSHHRKFIALFERRCRADMTKLIGKTISGTNHKVSEEMVEAIFNNDNLIEYCSPLK